MRVMITLALSAIAIAAQAQERSTCEAIGGHQIDRHPDQRMVQTTTYRCVIEDGPLKDGTISGTQFYTFDGLQGTLVSGSGVMRSPNGVAAYRLTEGATTLRMADGKIVGSSGKGRGLYEQGYGELAPRKGKTFQYAVETTGPATFRLVASDD